MPSNRYLLFLLLAFLFQKTFAEFEPCACKFVNRKSNFNTFKFLGLWFEYSRTPRDDDDDEDCVKYEMHETLDGIWPITISYRDLDDGEFVQIEIESRFKQVPSEGLTGDGYGYRIIDTDYRNYAVLYACMSIGYEHEEIAWILTRDKYPNDCSIHDAEKVLLDNGISPKSLQRTYQNC